MMQAQPRLSQVPLWERHVETVLAVLRAALDLLARESIRGTEPELNRRLYECLLRANRERRNRGESSLDVPLVWEARNQPTPSTRDGTAERKIPDFQCGYIDHSCVDPLESAIWFVVECKRLGPPSPSGWDFCARYVSDGVARFVDDEWQYGKLVNSGAMVGYLQCASDPAEALARVNRAAASQGLPPLAPRSDENSLYVRQLDHWLSRGFPRSPFRLVHAWVGDGKN